MFKNIVSTKPKIETNKFVGTYNLTLIALITPKTRSAPNSLEKLMSPDVYKTHVYLHKT